MHVQKSVAQLWGWLLLVTAACTPIQPVGLTTATPPPEVATAVATTAPVINGLQLSTTQSITQENTMSVPLPATNPVLVTAIKDLARRLTLPLEEITVVSAEAVVWPDSALGCPRPGMMYPQVLQDGMRIILKAGEQTYHYHSGETQAPFLCENPAK